MDLYAFMRAIQSQFPALLPLKVSIQRSIRKILRRPSEPEFRILDGMSVPPQSVLLDVGGNRGQSIDAIRLYQPHARIISFEPNLELAAMLSNRCALDPKLEIKPFGLSDRSSETELFVPYYNSFMYDGLASIDKERAHGWISSRTMARFDPSSLVIKTMPCRTETLDHLNLQVFFIKADVQGFERHLLVGGETTLKMHEPIVMLEASDGDAADELLTSWGWERAAYKNRALQVGEFGYPNTIYIPASKWTLFEHIMN